MTAQLHWQTTNNIATSLTNRVNNQSLIPSTDVIHWTHFDSEDDYCTGCWNVSHCTTTVLFRTTFTQTIILNLLIILQFIFSFSKPIVIRTVLSKTPSTLQFSPDLWNLIHAGGTGISPWELNIMVVLPVSYELRCMRILRLLKVVFIVMLSSSASICPEQVSVRMSAYLLQQPGSGVVPNQINGYFTNVCAACFDLECLTFKLLPPAHYMKFKWQCFFDLLLLFIFLKFFFDKNGSIKSHDRKKIPKLQRCLVSAVGSASVS